MDPYSAWQQARAKTEAAKSEVKRLKMVADQLIEEATKAQAEADRLCLIAEQLREEAIRAQEALERRAAYRTWLKERQTLTNTISSRCM